MLKLTYNRQSHILKPIIILVLFIFNYDAFSYQESARPQTISQIKKRYEEPIQLAIKLAEKEKKGWEYLQLRLNLFKEACQNLYDSKCSAFYRTVAVSSNPDSFSVSTNGHISNNDYSIKTLQIALNDRMTSLPIMQDICFDGAIFTIYVGKNQVKINFSRGGSLRDLLTALSKAKKLIRVQITPMGSQHNILVIEAAKTGIQHKLKFKGDLSIFEEIGLIIPDQEEADDNNQAESRYNFIQQAQDARVLFNDELISRDSNQLSDLIKGATINLIWSSPETHTIQITCNYDKIADDMQRFIDEHNNLMLYLKNTMSSVPKKSLRQLEQEEDLEACNSFEQREFNTVSGLTYQGTLAKDFAVQSLKSSLRKIITGSPYSRYERRRIKSIFDIGVIKPERIHSQEEQERYQTGYLFLNKKIFKNALVNHFEEIKLLFAHKTGQATIINHGIAVQLIQLLEKYTKKSPAQENGQKRGIIEQKCQQLDDTLKRLVISLEKYRKRTGGGKISKRPLTREEAQKRAEYRDGS